MPAARRKSGETRSPALLERLRSRGWRMTPQRRVVAEALAGEHVHLTAEEVYQRAVARLPEIGRATVYNTLGELARMGEIAEVSLGGAVKRYDPETVHRHQHLVCARCGATRDVHPAGESRLAVPGPERSGFTVDRVEIVFWGRCSRCAAAAS
jgi:Fur family transcriptional regulator, stress-responsive regulator